MHHHGWYHPGSRHLQVAKSAAKSSYQSIALSFYFFGKVQILCNRQNSPTSPQYSSINSNKEERHWKRRRMRTTIRHELLMPGRADLYRDSGCRHFSSDRCNGFVGDESLKYAKEKSGQWLSYRGSSLGDPKRLYPTIDEQVVSLARCMTMHPLQLTESYIRGTFADRL